jgi:hypothetical protein
VAQYHLQSPFPQRIASSSISQPEVVLPMLGVERRDLLLIRARIVKNVAAFAATAQIAFRIYRLDCHTSAHIAG